MPFGRKKSPHTYYDEAALYEYAIGALARQMRSVAELKRLMRRRVAGQEHGDLLVEVVVARLKEQHYLDDTQYATAYSGYRRENEKFGRLRVISDLKSKGVHASVIEKSVETAFAGVDEENLARQFLARKRLQKPSTRTEAARVFRALSRAGFSSRISLKILKNWDVDDEVIGQLEESGFESSDSPEVRGGSIPDEESGE